MEIFQLEMVGKASAHGSFQLDLVGKANAHGSLSIFQWELNGNETYI